MTENAKMVYILLLDFLKFQRITKPPPKDYKIEGVSYATLLVEISEKFLLGTELEDVRIFDAVSDAAARGANETNFKIYRAVLEKEKRKKFKDLVFVFSEMRKFRRKNLKTL